MGKEIPMEPAPPLDGVFADPGASIELRGGETYEDLFEYEDGHREQGRTRYDGRWYRLWVNDLESICIPMLEPITPLTRGIVRIVSRRKV
jgi:hypothetical protein